MAIELITGGDNLLSGGTVTGNLIITGTLNVQGVVTLDVAQTTTGLLSADGGILVAAAKKLTFADNGTAADPIIEFSDGSGIYGDGAASRIIFVGNGAQIGVLVQPSISIIQSSAAYYGFADGATVLGTKDTKVFRDAVGEWGFRDGVTNPHQLNVFNTWTSATVLEGAEFGWVSQANILTIGTLKGSGGGSARPLSIRTDEIEAINISTGQLVRLGALGTDGNDETPPETLSIIGGNTEIYDAGTLASESITDGAFPDSTNWAGATDWSDTISGNTTYTHSAGSGTLTQSNAQLAIAGKNNRWYKLTYTVSAVTAVGALACTITNAFAASAVTLDVSSNATRSVIFQSNSAADAADFVLSATSDTASDTFTLDDLILKEISGGDVIVGGKVTGGGSNGLAIDGDGNVTIDGALNHDGSTIGFYGVTPVTRPTVYTQTFSTADKTHENSTFAAIAETATTQTTPWGFASQAQGDAISVELNDLGDDVVDLKQLVNSIIDDLQALGLFQ